MLIQPQDVSYRTFSDLLTGYRLSLILMETARRGIMDMVGPGGSPREAVLDSMGGDRCGAGRFLDTLCAVGLLMRRGDFLMRSPFADTYLAADSPLAQLHTLGFEERLLENWTRLGEVVTSGSRPVPGDKDRETYHADLARFLGAMDEAARVRSREVLPLIPAAETGTILEIGAGSGAYLAAFLEKYPGWKGIFCDLPDVVETARAGGRLKTVGARIDYVACNLLDAGVGDVLAARVTGPVDILLMSNFIHCQGREENNDLMKVLAPLVGEGGLVVVHDFFNDTGYRGGLYDLHMMVNTYNGGVYGTGELGALLGAHGFPFYNVHPLPSGSAVVFGARRQGKTPVPERGAAIKQRARELGFLRALEVTPSEVPVGLWVREKCRTGCPNYNRKGACPPHSPEPDYMKRLLAEFRRGVVLVGEPPLKDFHGMLLELEKYAFLSGHPRALVFSGGPCSLCEECSPGDCRQPDKRRFSLEACGCDVFGLAEKVGILLTPLGRKTDFVQYIGLLLLE